MSSDSVISVESLGKRYRIRHQQQGGMRYKALRDVLADGTKSVARRLWSLTSVLRTLSSGPSSRSPVVSGSRTEDFWALKDVCFEVQQGETLGIIGRNGAGKSTLLKILSRITEPTEGRVRIKGRVASLLEVGTGFHPELTGRENIYLNGAILGMTRAEIRKKFDEIVAFAEVDKFLDTPVKRYSSGMYVRLAFAVAAHLEPEILVVDEVLAVGDAEFQRKCVGKMHDASKGGRTILFVSHNMSAVRNLCPRGIVMEMGRLALDADGEEAIATYARLGFGAAGATWTRPPELPIREIGFETIQAILEGMQPKHCLSCTITLRGTSAGPPVFVAVDICDRSLTPIMQALPKPNPFIPRNKGRSTLLLEIDLPPLIPGLYSADFWVGPDFSRDVDYVRNVIQFEVTDSPSSNRTCPHSPDHGFLVPVSRCSITSK